MCGIEGKCGKCDREIVRTMMSPDGSERPDARGLFWGV